MPRSQPHAIAPSKSSARALLVHKMFGASRGLSHIGLGVAALNTARSLRAAGLWADVHAAASAAEIESKLVAMRNDARAAGEHPISHVVISAPWIPTPDLQGLLMRWPDVHFAVVSHSNVGFLSADPNGIKLLREGAQLALGHHNFSLAGNCERFTQAWQSMYGQTMEWLPNLYDVSTIKSVGQRMPWHPGAPLRIGVFGATRPLKNMITATAACVGLSSQLKTDVEIWVSSGRAEGGSSVSDAIKQLVSDLPHCKLVESGWQAWPGFRQVVSRMNLLLSPSYTESFNMVTADGAAEGVASVVGDAIDWAPADWIASTDDVGSISRVARRLLHDPHAVTEGQAALRAYVGRGVPRWQAYLRG